jgi:hypothetical protein
MIGIVRETGKPYGRWKHACLGFHPDLSWFKIEEH